MLTIKNTSVSRGLDLGNRRSVLPRFGTLPMYLVLYLTIPFALAGGSHASAQQSPIVRLSSKQRATCLRVLREGMEGDEFWPSIHAVEGLIEAGEAATVVPWLRRKLAQETDDQRRCGLARELVRAGHRSATRVLLEILGDSKSNGRTHAAESLYKVAEIGDGRVLRQLLTDASDPPRQIMAAAALARWGHPDAFRLLRQRLANPQSQRQLQLAAWVLARVGDRSDIRALRKAIPEAKEPLVRAYIEHALARLGDPDGQALLRKNLEDSDGAIRTYAATFAGEVRDPRAVSRLLAMLEDDVVDARIRAAHSLLQMASPPPTGNAPIVRDVFPPTEEAPRWSEGSVAYRRDGTLLYATTQFLGSASDFATARLVARTSPDLGQHWGPLRVLQENTGRQNVMSVSLVYLGEPLDPETPLALFYLVKNSPSDLNVFMRVSKDDGRTFGESRRVTSGPGYFVMNNDRVVRLTSGRLLVPTAWTSDVGRVNHFTIRVWYSDDNGRSWQESPSRLDYAKRGAMEPGIVELEDGSLLMIVRTQLGHIAVSRSRDRGMTWSKLEASTVVSPESPATIGRIPSTGDLVLVWNNRFQAGQGHGGKRTPLVAAISGDGGRTWSKPRPLETAGDRTFAYTSVAFAKGRILLTYYVRDEATGRIGSRYRSVPIGWLYASGR